MNKIILSRTDSIGDVVLTLPVAGLLKERFPGTEIIFLGRNYTKDIVLSSDNVDDFISYDELIRDNSGAIQKLKDINADVFVHIFPVKEIATLAKKAQIPLRIGTTGRLYHYMTCNKLVALSRKRSGLHEAQLNIKLLSPLLKKIDIPLKEIPKYYGFTKIAPLKNELRNLIDKNKFNLILHPKSKGSAREWGTENFGKLIEILPGNKFKIFITGTKPEGELIKKTIIDKYQGITDLTGKLTLKELISFINGVDGLVAASTGPLHIAAALGKFALGIYPPIRPMHPGRWAPVGFNAGYLVLDKKCSKCRHSNKCECMESITPGAVKERLLSYLR